MTNDIDSICSHIGDGGEFDHESRSPGRAVAASPQDFRIAQTIVNCDPVLRSFGAVEWDELNDDAKNWLAVIVREAAKGSAELRVAIERKTVARCIQLVLNTRDEFLTSEHTVDQPVGGLMERVVCDRCIDAIGAEFVMSSNEQRILVGRKTHIEEYRAAQGRVQALNHNSEAQP